MKFMLDTHLLVWTAREPARLSSQAVRIIADPVNQLFFSSVSIWEIAIKQGLGRASFTVDARTLRKRLVENGYLEVAMNSEHAVATDALPPIHQDPFDRILIAQARIEGLTLLTGDSKIAQYTGPIRKV